MVPSSLLPSIPTALRTALVEALSEICRNYAERRWEPSELNGGKLCEVVCCIVQGALSGAYPNSPTKPANMLIACQALERLPASASRLSDRSLRILIPRLLVFLYEIRNNRGVGHVGGDVDPNFMDALMSLSACNWIMAELVRVFHNLSIEDAQQLVDALAERRIPLVWQRGAMKRVL